MAKKSKSEKLSELYGVMARFDITQKTLTKWTGRSEAYINKILLGKADPYLSVCKKIYKHLEEIAEQRNTSIPTFKEIFNA